MGYASVRFTLQDQADGQWLNLPWELVELENNLPIGCDPRWSVRRSPLPKDVSNMPLAAGPLRVLFLAAAPREQAQLDFEREEEAILKATTRLPREVVLRFADLGRFDELAELVAEVRPHIVHLSGHGRVLEDGRGTFTFEDERGYTDARAAEALAVDILSASPVRCVFLNGCQTSQAAVSGLCQSLVRAGLPIAVGWSASVADDQATEFATEFYRWVVRGVTAPVAMAHARRAIQTRGRHRTGATDIQDATYALPQLYASTAEGRLFDETSPPEPYHGPRTEYFLLGDGIVGLREGFVGRRREQQRLLPAIWEGETTVAVLTGLGGAGKSTLATRVANRLAADGFHVVPIKVKRFEGESPAEVARRTLSDLIAGFETAFIELDRKDLHDRLIDGQVELGIRLRSAVRALNELRVLIVLDNVEDCLELETRSIADPDLVQCYAWFATDLTRGSRLLITCRYLPKPTPENAPTFRHEPLPDFEEATFQKFLRRNTAVEQRLQQGELTRDPLSDIYRHLGGTPGFLSQVRDVLADIAIDDLTQELAGEAEGELEQRRHAYFERIFVRRLFRTLPAASQELLGCLAMSDLPLPLDALEGIAASLPGDNAASPAAGCDVLLQPAQSYGLVQTFTETGLPDLFQPPGLLRTWLLEEADLAADTIRPVHGHLSQFWRETVEADRHLSLRASLTGALNVCRQHAVQAEDHPAFLWATNALARVLHRRAEWPEARALLEAVPEAQRDTDLRRLLARLQLDMGDWQEARRTYESMPPSDGDNAEAAYTWYGMATIDMHEGNYDDAKDKFTKALNMRQRIGDQAGEAATWHNMATIDLREGHYDDAKDKFTKALDIKQRIGDQAGEAATWHQMATIDVHEGNYDDAKDKFTKALNMRQRIGDQAGEAATWHNMATIDLNEGNYDDAKDKFTKALNILQRIGDRYGEGMTFYQLGVLAFRLGAKTYGIQLAAMSFSITQAIGHSDARRIGENILGMCQELGYNEEQVKNVLQEAAEAYRQDRGQRVLAQAFERVEPDRG